MRVTFSLDFLTFATTLLLELKTIIINSYSPGKLILSHLSPKPQSHRENRRRVPVPVLLPGL